MIANADSKTDFSPGTEATVDKPNKPVLEKE